MVHPSCFSFSLKGRTRMTTRTLSSLGEDEVGSFAMEEENEDDDEAMARAICEVLDGWRLAQSKNCSGSCANVMGVLVERV